MADEELSKKMYSRVSSASIKIDGVSDQIDAVKHYSGEVYKIEKGAENRASRDIAGEWYSFQNCSTDAHRLHTISSND